MSKSKHTLDLFYAPQTIIIGTSWGGLDALTQILSKLPENFSLPILIVQHRHRLSDDHFINILNEHSHLHVKDARDKDDLSPGIVYIAPANYHLLLEENNTLSLSDEPLINYSRPSINVLFETAAEVLKEKAVGIILTGANSDGAQGLKRVKKCGGITIVQRPDSANAPAMPEAAIELVDVDYILTIDEITHHLIELDQQAKKNINKKPFKRLP